MGKRQPAVLIIGSSPAELSRIRDAVGAAGWASQTAESLSNPRPSLPFDATIVCPGAARSDPRPPLARLRELPGFVDRPILALADGLDPAGRAALLDLGADDALSMPFDDRELVGILNARLRGTRALEELRERTANLERLATTDGLTGLLNHRHFQARLDEEFRRARRYKLPLAVLVVDLDLFKAINDAHGHLVGDSALRHASELIARSVRETDLLARYGGEEFAAILPQTSPGDARRVAERIRANLEAHPMELGAGRLAITGSIGVAHYPEPTLESAGSLLAMADAALYQAKANGRNQVVLAGMIDLAQAPRPTARS